MISTILAELHSALLRFLQTGETYTIFINKMGLSQQDREALHEHLGQGNVRIKLENTDEPAEWLESSISGIWLGVFYDHQGNPVLETVEVAAFPPVAGAQQSDMQQGAAQLKILLEQLA